MVLRPAAGAFRHFRISLAGDHRIHFDVLRRNYKTALAVSTVPEISVAEKPDKGRKRFLKYIFLVFLFKESCFAGFSACGGSHKRHLPLRRSAMPAERFSFMESNFP